MVLGNGQRWWAPAVVLGASLVGCRDPGAGKDHTSGAPSASARPAASARQRSIAPLILPLGGTSDRAPATKPDPHWAERTGASVELDDTFLLELGMGSGSAGLNVTTIASSGRASHVYQGRAETDAGTGGRSWRRVDFRVTPAELSALVRVLNDHDVLGLQRSYVDPQVQDGAQWIVHVRTAGRDKFVYLSNAFPAPVLSIARFVSGLIDKRPELEGRSRPSELSSHDTHLWRWHQWYAGCKQDVSPVVDDEGCMPLWITARLHPETALPPGAKFEVVIADRSAPGRELAREQGSLGAGAVSVRQADVTLTVRYDDVDLSHRYELEARVFTSDRSWRGGPHRVITYGEPHELILPLEETDGG